MSTATTAPVPHGLTGLPGFLSMLADYPDPDHVLDALLAGPLEPRGVRTARIWIVVDAHLVAIAGSGFTSEEDERYAVLPGELDLGLWRSVRTGAVLVTSDARHPSPQFDAVDGPSWSELLSRVGGHSVVRVPITQGGRGVGGLGLITDRPWPDDPGTSALLDCVGSALGLWATHPRSGAMERAQQVLRRRGRTLALSERQREILVLAEDGLSNPQIAARLRLSTSTVKQDLLNAMRALGTAERQEAPARARSLGLL